MKKNKFLTLLVATPLLIVGCNKQDTKTTTETTATAPNSEVPANAETSGSAMTSGSTQNQANKDVVPSGTPTSAANPTEAQKHETPKMDDAGLLQRIHHTNEQEIIMGKLAEQKGSSKYIKEYGKTILSDHTDADKKVSSLAKSKSITLGSPTLTDAEKAKQKEHEALMTKLKSLKGKEFDKEFIEGMKAGHEDAIHLLETAQVDDKEVKALVGDLLPTLRKHYRASVDIVQDIGL